MIHLDANRLRIRQDEAVTVAREVLDRKRGIADATRALASLGHDLQPDAAEPVEDFPRSVAIYSALVPATESEPE